MSANASKCDHGKGLPSRYTPNAIRRDGNDQSPDDKITPAAAAQGSQSDEPLIEERRTIITEYVSYLEILKWLRKQLK